MGIVRASWLLAAILTIGAHLPTAASASEAKFRIEGGFGWNTTTSAIPNERFTDGIFTVELDSASLGGGMAWGTAFWVDDWIGRNWSVGLQYFGSRLNGDASTTVGILGFPLAGAKLDLKGTVHAFGANIAWRKNQGRWHPHIGGGLFVGFVDLRFSGLRGLAGSGGIDKVDLDAPIAGVQGFLGLDYDLTDRIYIGVSGRSAYVDGRPIGVDIRVLDFVGLAHIGFKF